MLTLRDNSLNSLDGVSLEEKESLDSLSGIPLKDLPKSFPNLVLWGKKEEDFSDESSSLWSVDGKDLHTHNVMGFLSIDGMPIKISSRFADQEKDYFLHYMLQKTFLGTIINWEIPRGSEEIHSFLYYLFPKYLDNALKVGLYKEYEQKHYNNANIRGRIDLPRHLRQNTPFAYKVATTLREHSFDNRISRIISYTIGHILKKPMGRLVLNGNHQIRSNVEKIKEICPNLGLRREIIAKGSRKITNPYWKNYEALRLLCLQILKEDKLSFDNLGQGVHGILFDGAVLWEEYLNSVLKDLGFQHPHNRSQTDGLPLFKDGRKIRYPDFYYKKDSCFKIVADAKYKGLKEGSVDREISHQLITYMYITWALDGIFLYPAKETRDTLQKPLEGYGGRFHWFPVFVDHRKNTFEAYAAEMKSIEEAIKENLRSILRHPIGISR